MTRISKSQDREEKRKMNRSVTTSVVALFLCWAPVLGVLLSAVGFIGVMKCITERYVRRFVVSVIAVSLILVICVSVFTFEVYAYSRDPNIVQNVGTRLLEIITGEYADDYNYMGGTDYSGMDDQGLGYNDDLYSGSYSY